MGIFSNSSPFDEQLDKATNQLNTETDWGLILALSDKVSSTANGPVLFAPAILSKMNNKVPHVSMQAITVLDACVNNCGKEFHKMLASSGFTEGLRDFLNRYKNPTVTRRMRYFIKKWADEYKDDANWSKFISFYYELKSEGLDFPDTEDDKPSKRQVETTSNPDAVSSAQEAEDIAKAIEASLKEEKQKKGTSGTSGSQSSSLYPSIHSAGGSTSTTASSFVAAPSQKRKVKALYDFEAAEDNELTFKTGDIITILDDSDVNWWKGEGSNGAGLFPSNFVTSDLSKETDEEVLNEKKQTTVQFNETLEVKEVNQSEPVLQVDEDLIDQTLAALQSTDPETTTSDPVELMRDEDSCMQMGKLIDNQLEDLDRKHLELTVLNEKILDSLKMYDNLMKQASMYSAPVYTPMSHPGHAPVMPGGYSPNPQYNSPYMAQQQPPAGAIPQQMPIGTEPGPGYNPMYQAPPTTSYAPPTDGSNMEQPQGGVPQNTPYPSMRHPQTDMMSYSTSTTNMNYQDPSMIPHYQPSMLGPATTANYSSNHVTSQPLM